MYIIDKNKDYYDFYSTLYGIDKTITYDRRGSTILNNNAFVNKISDKNYYGGEQFVLLEVGYYQYLFHYYDFTYQQNPNYEYKSFIVKNYKIKLIKIFNENKHLFNSEISIVTCNLENGGMFYYRKYGDKYIKNLSDIHTHEEKYGGTYISNPILADTDIPKFIDGLNIWKNLSMYISSKYNDKTILIVNSDTDKIINHGFDKKSSFRHPIK